eukprot:TRINITY_DN15453_c0_g2_i1.p1 TRINITY_DN15453_c0_g2~~TRINITY_DN15453_c0_g2_i1.p1  ORF type:complete len:144 (+),score=19.29 TRINITY_DN15453_c0_g2_i1:36-434(+)
MEGMESMFAAENSLDTVEHKFLDDSPNPIMVKLMSLPLEGGQIARNVSQVLWPSASQLTSYLLRNTALFAHKDVVELGAGTGLLGIALYRAGKAKSVLLTDGDTSVFVCLREVCRTYCEEYGVEQRGSKYSD